jgi:hypothetical protein
MRDGVHQCHNNFLFRLHLQKENEAEERRDA